jgi:hypothetical protein
MVPTLNRRPANIPIFESGITVSPSPPSPEECEGRFVNPATASQPENFARIDRPATVERLAVEVIPSRVAGCPHETDRLSGFDNRTSSGQDSGHVGVQGSQATTMVEFDRLSVRSHSPRTHDPPRFGCEDRRSGWSRQVDPRVEGVPQSAARSEELRDNISG